jgi:hypothetical protein
MKTCPKCGECKLLSDFSKDKTHKDGLQSHCKPCRAQFKKHRRKAYNEASRKQCKRWREENREAYRKYVKHWGEENQDKRNARTAKRRAAKLQRTPHWLTKNQLDEIETFYTAALAFRLYTGQEYHVDHIVPLQGKNVSGLHVPWNLRVISAIDNLKKSNLFED